MPYEPAAAADPSAYAAQNYYTLTEADGKQILLIHLYGVKAEDYYKFQVQTYVENRNYAVSSLVIENTAEYWGTSGDQTIERHEVTAKQPITHTPVSYTHLKEWADNDDRYHTRPDSVRFELYRRSGDRSEYEKVPQSMAAPVIITKDGFKNGEALAGNADFKDVYKRQIPESSRGKGIYSGTDLVCHQLNGKTEAGRAV